MDTISKNQEYSEDLILYALGELDAVSMAEIDKKAFDDPDMERTLEQLLQLVSLMEQSPELAAILMNKSLFASFLEYLADFGRAIWPWRESKRSKIDWSYLKKMFLMWRRQREQPELASPRYPLLESPRFIKAKYLMFEERPLSACDMSMQMCCGNISSSFEFDSAEILANDYPDPQLSALENDPDGYTANNKNVFVKTADEPFATFGLDVDTASYTIGKTYIEQYHKLPPPESVREEEYINYFDWDLPEPDPNDSCPFKPTATIGRHPLKPELLLAKIGIQGKRVNQTAVPPLNLTYLIDVSGSMADWNKLPLIRESLSRLLERLRPCDTVSIVTYGNYAKVALASTPCNDRIKIEKVIQSLIAEGCTNGSEGLKFAYQETRKNFSPDKINRVILCSDGDFNMGVSDRKELGQLIKQEAKSGVFLTVLGFGMGNYKDNLMEVLANKGQGSYHYINDRQEAQRVMEDQLFSTLVTIAKDVKIQVDFNPAQIASWRLIGYENRVMEAKDFNNDQKESGNIGSGQNVVALLELVPKGVKNSLETTVDKSRYARETPEDQTPQENPAIQACETAGLNPFAQTTNELFFVKIRWKNPTEAVSQYQDFPVVMPSEEQFAIAKENPDFRFAYAVALFAQILSESRYTAGADFCSVLNLIQSPASPREQQLIDLIKKI